MQTKEKLFIYGTLTDSEVQKTILGRLVNGIPAALNGYKKFAIKLDGENYPMIIPCKGCRVEGKVIEVSRAELRKIDKYETGAYRRVKVILENGERVWVYIRDRAHKELLCETRG